MQGSRFLHWGIGKVPGVICRCVPPHHRESEMVSQMPEATSLTLAEQYTHPHPVLCHTPPRILSTLWFCMPSLRSADLPVHAFSPDSQNARDRSHGDQLTLLSQLSPNVLCLCISCQYAMRGHDVPCIFKLNFPIKLSLCLSQSNDDRYFYQENKIHIATASIMTEHPLSICPFSCPKRIAKVLD